MERKQQESSSHQHQSQSQWWCKIQSNGGVRSSPSGGGNIWNENNSGLEPSVPVTVSMVVYEPVQVEVVIWNNDNRSLRAISTSHSLSGGVRSNQGGNDLRNNNNRSLEPSVPVTVSVVVYEPVQVEVVYGTKQQGFRAISTSHSLSGGVRSSPMVVYEPVQVEVVEWNKQQGFARHQYQSQSQWWCKIQSKWKVETISGITTTGVLEPSVPVTV
ncbi:hypothetical protein JCM33374_g5247 [Metschnikowia sp. JCM 33374]|nr:hypothetical protein JCM33374_g5247 [Metschnikowia sp. JCM 33374]